MATSSTAVRPPYVWPDVPLDVLFPDPAADGLFRAATTAEDRRSLGSDSRWPGFFPAPIGFVSSGSASNSALERVVGPMIVNRFPLVMAVSLCRETLSDRHYARHATMAAIERNGTVALQFLAPGPSLDSALKAIAGTPDERTAERFDRAGLATMPAPVTATQTFADAYLVYEGRLARPGTSLEGAAIYEQPWADVGSHRIYFFEVVAISLKSPIARGERQIAWQSLPLWQPAERVAAPPYDAAGLARAAYVKSYTPDYRFPSRGTVAFEADAENADMSIRHIAPLEGIPRAVDNDAARWPCFFPSSAGMLTAWQDDGRATAMPCGSTAVISRFPFTIGACISNSAINERYAPRATLRTVRARGTFGVGVPYSDDQVVRAISYLGNLSARDDADKVAHSGLTALNRDVAPLLAQLPVHFECRLTGEIPLGTHVMMLGAVEKILVRRDVTPARPLSWQPWASIA